MANLTSVFESVVTPEKFASEGSTVVHNAVSGTNFPVSNLQAINPKLSEENYRYWRAQVLYTVGAHNLRDHLIGVLACLIQCIVTKDDSGTLLQQPNPKYSIWKRYDDLLMSWLMALISESMFGQVSKCENANQVWNRLED